MDKDLIVNLYILFVLIAYIVIIGVLAWIAIDFIFGLIHAPLHVKIAVWLLFMLFIIRVRIERN